MIIFWAVPVMIVAANEIREQLAYDAQDLAYSLSTWTFTDAQRSSPAVSRCHGSLDEVRAAGCPPDVLTANAAKNQDAVAEYSTRRSVLFGYLWHAFVGYWVVPAVTLFLLGAVIGVIRRSLWRPPTKSGKAKQANESTRITKP
ncbi:MAG: Kynurenine formamidase, bacterial (EC [Candidatus Burkholderia crenata]|nr:MAG: Kynurenine formamidase, bacterial (EC [Candidatus Burkholderia crenata]